MSTIIGLVSTFRLPLQSSRNSQSFRLFVPERTASPLPFPAQKTNCQPRMGLAVSVKLSYAAI